LLRNSRDLSVYGIKPQITRISAGFYLIASSIRGIRG